MMISLILATLGRRQEVKNFLDKLLQQSYMKYELIIVDQNMDDRVRHICLNYKNKLDIKYIHTNEKGLSHARNIGLQYAKGKIIAFPDDDCWYDPNTLKLVNDLLSDETVDGVCGCPIDRNHQPLIHNFLDKKTFLDKKNVWHGGISFTIFLRNTVVKSVGNFDERLGVGSSTVYGSGEETDYLLRAIENRFKLLYTPQLNVFHPRKDSTLKIDDCVRARKYGMGMGAVLKKHDYSCCYFMKVLIRPLGGALLALFSFNKLLAQYRLNTFIGRALGWIYVKNEDKE